MTKYPDLFADLAAPFEQHEVKSRSQANRQFRYVTARTVMNRLDEVLGPENWSDEYEQNQHSVVCKLTVRMPDGMTVTKQDIGAHAGMQDEGDDEKSGFSDAFKRVAAKFGVGRYLYGDGAPRYRRAVPIEPVVVVETTPTPPVPTTSVNGRANNGHVNANNNTNGHHNAPNGVTVIEAHPHRNGHVNGSNGSKTPQIVPGPTPKSGKALFGWAKDIDQQRSDASMVKFLTSWGKTQEFPVRMVDWDPEMVGMAHSEATRRLQTLGPARSEERELVH